MTAQQSAAADWGTNTKTRTETHACQHRLPRFAGVRIFFQGGRHGDPGAGRERERKKLQCDPSRTEDTLLDPSGQPRQKNLPLSFLKEERGGVERQNSITQSKTTPCPLGVISAPFKSLITHKTNNILTPW